MSNHGKPPRLLAVGQQTIVLVSARAFWTDTGLETADGGLYRCVAMGQWWDFVIPSGPDGYETKWWAVGQGLSENRRRVPTARWMALCGALGDGGASPFVIGAQATLQLATGRLMCFANDVPHFYWNNLGSVTLTIERIG